MAAVGGDSSSDQEDGKRGDMAVLADVIRLAPGWLDVAVLVGQLTGDTLPQTVEMTHELGQGAGGAHGRAVGADGFEQGENLKLLVVT
jgi:hypothetical protein